MAHRAPCPSRAARGSWGAWARRGAGFWPGWGRAVRGAARRGPVPPVGLGAPGNTNGSAPGPVGGRNGRTGDCARTVKPAELHAGREHYGTLRLRLRLGTNFVLVRYRPDE